MKYLQRLLISRMYLMYLQLTLDIPVCLDLYLRRYERSLIDSSPLPRASKKRATFQMEIERIKSILDQGNGLTLREIRDTINSKQDEVEIPNQRS